MRVEPASALFPWISLRDHRGHGLGIDCALYSSIAPHGAGWTRQATRVVLEAPLRSISATNQQLPTRRAPSLQAALSSDRPAGASAISSVTTWKRISCVGPKDVEIATSAASRPRAMTMRPMRGWLCRASKVNQRLSEHFEPGAEVHGGRIAGHADVPEITGAVAGRNVHATAEGDG